MSKTNRASNPQYHVHSLHEYVLAPLSTSVPSRARADGSCHRAARLQGPPWVGNRHRDGDIHAALHTALVAPRGPTRSTVCAPRTTVIPERHRESFVRQLGTIAEHRQETFHTRGDLSVGSDYSLSTQLYGDAAWTYSVLVAVARVRKTVTLGEPRDSLASPYIRESR